MVELDCLGCSVVRDRTVGRNSRGPREGVIGLFDGCNMIVNYYYQRCQETSMSSCLSVKAVCQGKPPCLDI